MFDQNRHAQARTAQPQPCSMPTLPCFDELALLYKQNPEQFERLRAQLIEQLILSAPQRMQQRLRGLQFRIDMERRKARNPIAACVRLTQMMRDSLVELEAVLSNPAEFLRLREQQTEADIIPFPRQQR